MEIYEGGEATLSFTIPNTEQVNDAPLIYIKIERQDGAEFDEYPDVLSVDLNKSVVKIMASYKRLMEGVLEGRRLRIILDDVRASDFGYYRCYSARAESEVISNCGQRLVLQGKLHNT